MTIAGASGGEVVGLYYEDEKLPLTGQIVNLRGDDVSPRF